ncbi:uncharacterized protein EI90DRAFT_2818082, partial [Cantharellus anzutake]|uniref:uncharacterized protein n=1 Tax=Cantharellus anzutake TaxID=1750568 RepID=UPI0019086DAD
VCYKCHRSLKRGRIPKTALANDLYFGPIPSQLADLTIIEEALIARRRAKKLDCHVIVFPAKPEALSPFLPPALKEVITPLCVVFVGHVTPTKEWLLKNARPLIVRQEKVRLALEWLIHNNPLYADVILHEEHLNSLPALDVAPVMSN